MPSTDADEMANDFTELVNDLAYAKTFYPSSKVTQYINGQASRIYLSIYRNRKEDTNRIVAFWKYDLPLTIRKHHRMIFFTLFVFLVFFVVGFFSSRQDEAFTRSVLSGSYVDKTIQNIEDGNPFGVYQSGNSFLSWVGIMINNIGVAIRYFAQGILFGYFTLKSVVEFGVMVGVFYELFFSRGLGLDWGLAVMIHGTLEIWAFVVSAAAGMVLGMGFIFPGTLSRLESLKRAAKDGTKMLVGCIPVFAMAAFFEGFVTRHYHMHWAMNVLILIASVTFILWYFIIYPIRVQKRFSQPIIEEA